MRISLLLITLFLLSVMTISSKENKNDYLRKVLSNLENIKTVTYRSLDESWEPGDTTTNTHGFSFVEEYNNPEDSTIGASWVNYTDGEVKQIRSCYDGAVIVSFYHDKHGVVVDNFTFRKLPFRPIGSPFFNNTKNIIKYALTTPDSISVDVKDCGVDYFFRLVIHEDEQVEFFGPGHHLPKPPFDIGDPTSICEMWISKSDDLPYKVRREMSHSISAKTCFDAQINKLAVTGIKASDYIPEDYEVREYGEKYDTKPKSDLTGKKAPDWTLTNIEEQKVSLSALKSKVVLIEFTGIGCGPCVASIPFLNKLKNEYKAEDLTVIGIETWKRKIHSLQNYASRHKIGYMFLSGNDEIVDNYQVGLAAPAFFILDENRVIRRIVRGYSPESAGKEITNLINELLESDL